MSQNQNRVLVPLAGTSQYSRAKESLFPEYALVDERDISDLLSFAAEYGKLLHYYNERNRIDGDWQLFWLKDISIFLANLGHTDYLKYEKQYNDIVEEMSVSHTVKEKIIPTRDLILLIQSMQLLLNDWYEQMTRINAVKTKKLDGIELDLYNIIKLNLSKNILQLESYQQGLLAEGMFTEEQLVKGFGLSKVWGNIASVEPAEFSGSSKMKRLNMVIKKIELIYNAFYKAILHIIQKIPKYLQKSLEEDDNHMPNTSLYIAFLRLFQIQQAELNSISSRHLDYYYFDILKDRLRDGISDKAHIYFELGSHVKRHFLPAGTAFSGGKNSDNEDIIYLLDKDTTLTSAYVASLKTVFISKNLFFGGSDYRLIANVYAAPIANSSDGVGGDFEGVSAPIWPTFGEDQFEMRVTDRTMTEASLGFALTSPILFLEEGDRTITMTLDFEPESMQTYRKLLANLVQIERQKSNLTSESDIFTKNFSDSFDIKVTGENGWLPIEKYEVFLPEGTEGTQIAIAFMLLPSEDSIIAHDEELHASGIQTHWPMIEFNLRPGKPTYSFMRDLMLSNINLKVDVENIKNFDIFNDLGRLDASKSFQPFGATPVQGASLIIGKSELFRKNLTDLSMKIVWQNLPKLKGGFSEYYKNYGLPIDNDIFKAELTALSNSEFHPKLGADPIEFSLFNTKESRNNRESRLDSDLELKNFSLKKLNIQPDFYLNNIDDYDQNKRGGYFKITLTSPEYGFGQDVYPKVFTDIVTANAAVPTGPLGGKPPTPKEIPNQPFIPVIKSLTMGYKAESSISMKSSSSRATRRSTPEELYHIHPFGKVKTFTGGLAMNRFVVPQYDEDGYLYIGLEGVMAPEPLSLYFELVENNINLTDKEFRLPIVTWSFLSKNEWKAFDKNHIISDTTLDFTRSGIVTLDLPNNITKSNTILPADYYWLRIAVSGDVEILSKALEVKAQGASVTWKVDENDMEHLTNPLPPNSITDLFEADTAISEVFQPFESYGGRPKETKKAFYSRMSDRLHHKQRGITASNIEHLILENFPDIRQVRCYTPISNPDLVVQGEVNVVVIPARKRNLDYDKPLVNYQKLLEIQEFVESITSEFAKIKVMNPVYEFVKVNCDVIFYSDGNEGMLFKQLNEDIKKYICPWIEDKDVPINLGGGLNKDSMLAFIEQLDYIKFVTRLSIVQVFQNNSVEDKPFEFQDTASGEKGSSVLNAYTPWSILVPVEMHSFTLLDAESYNAPTPAGVDSMRIGVDFLIREEEKEADDDFFQPVIKGEPDAVSQRFILSIDLERDINSDNDADNNTDSDSNENLDDNT